MAGEQTTVSDNSVLRNNDNDSPRLSESNGIGSLNLSDVRRLTSSNVTSNLHSVTIEGTKGGGTGSGTGLVSGARFSDIAGGMFRQLDRDGNGHVSNTELNRAMGDHSFRGERAQVVAALHEHQGAISRLNPEFTLSQGITRGDLSRFGEIASAPAAFSNGALVGQVESTMGDVHRNSQRPAHQLELYTGLNTVRPDAIRNGNGGPGTFESTLSALAASNPDAIRSMIRENANGTFTVTFPGDREHPITVSRPTEAELGRYRASTKGGIWPDVMAKAYGEYAQQHSKIASRVTSQDAIQFSTIGQQDLMHLLTGDRAQRNGWFDNLADNLTRAFTEDRMVVARSSAGIYDPLIPRTRDGLQNNHTYAVIGWDRRGDNGGTVTLADPSVPGSNRIRLSLESFRRNFNQIDFERATPPAPARAPRLPERGPQVVARQNRQSS